MNNDTSVQRRDRQLLRFAVPRPKVGVEPGFEPEQGFDVTPDVASENSGDSVVVDARDRFYVSQGTAGGLNGEIGGETLSSYCGGHAVEFRRGPVPGDDVTPWWPPASSTHEQTLRGSEVDHSFALPAPVGEGLSKQIDRILARIMNYRPQLPPEQWERIEGIVRSAVASTEPKSDARTKDLLSVVCRLCAWCDVEGLPLNYETIFHIDIIEEFVLHGMSKGSPGSQANRRSMLYRVAEAVLGPDTTPSRQTPLPPSSPISPYTKRELVAFENWSLGRPTFWQRHNFLVLLALGSGAGMSTEDLLTVTGADITVDDDGVLVTCGGRRARTVPVLSRWENTLGTAAATVGDDGWLFRPHRTTNSKKSVSNFVARHPTVGLPNLTAQRLRATWIIHHLASRTPLAALVPAAGVGTLHALSRYLDFVPDMDIAEQHCYLRGEK